MARFFISHSATAGSRAEAILRAVQRQLVQAGHEVFVDSLISPGQRWRARLFDELGRCDAGVVLLDEEALKPTSWWVRREVYYLLWRHYLGSVWIRGVLLDGIKPGTVRRQGYGELVELQLILTPDEDVDADDVAARLIGDLGAVPCVTDDNMRRWINRIFTILSKVDPGETLDIVAADLGVEPGELAHVFELERHRFLAHQLLGRPGPARTLRALETIADAIGRDQTALLARHALPALVDGEAAWRLLQRDHLGDADRRPVFVLNARFPTTSQLYVMRAACAARSYRHGAVPSSATGPDLVVQLERDCELALAKMLHIRTTWPIEEIRRRLADYRPGAGEIVEAGFLTIEAVHGQMAGVAQVVRTLRSRYPWLAVIILTGPAVPESTDEWDVGHVVVLQPPMSADEENKVDEALMALTDLTGEEVLAHG